MRRSRILVADDEEMIRTIIRLVLEDTYDIVEAADGEEAWQKFTNASPTLDLVVMDLTMPRLDGQTLLQQMLARYPNTPIILLTGRLDYAQKPHPLVRVITKPFDNAALAKTVAHLLASSSRS